mmetsp:Transcript_32720/g.75486  ORF Transcript_32720/g.75486 Transcript_32720/m.75486 type:complete len:280 (+) Transcript_32720:286-1125(+)
MPAMASIARRPLLISFDWVALKPVASFFMAPLASKKPMSPGMRDVSFIFHGASDGDLKVGIEVTVSARPMNATTTGQKVCSGVCWNANTLGPLIAPPKRGWNCSLIKNPAEASIARRPCLISHSWKRAKSSSCSSGLSKFLVATRPAGSKKPKGAVMPAALFITALFMLMAELRDGAVPWKPRAAARIGASDMTLRLMRCGCKGVRAWMRESAGVFQRRVVGSGSSSEYPRGRKYPEENTRRIRYLVVCKFLIKRPSPGGSHWREHVSVRCPLAMRWLS